MNTMTAVVKTIAYGVGYMAKAIETGYKEGQKDFTVKQLLDRVDAVLGTKKEA